MLRKRVGFIIAFICGLSGLTLLFQNAGGLEDSPYYLRLTNSPGEKSQSGRISVLKSDGKYLIAWEEDVAIERRPDCWALWAGFANPKCFAVRMTIYDEHFNRLYDPWDVVTQHPFQYGAFLTGDSNQSSLLYYYSMTNGKGTGDRDIAVVPFTGLFPAQGNEKVLVHDDLTNNLPPRNDSVPTVLSTPTSNILIYSEGYFYDTDNGVALPSPCRFSKYYCDKNLVAKVFDKNWVEQKTFNITDGSEVGLETSPDAVQWNNMNVVAYMSEELQDEPQPNPNDFVYHIFLKVFDSNWKLAKKIPLTFPIHAYPRLGGGVGGAITPSMAVLNNELYIAFGDQGRNDIHVWKLGSDFNRVAELKVNTYLNSIGQSLVPIFWPKLIVDFQGGLRLFHGGTVLYNPNTVPATVQTDILSTRLPLDRFVSTETASVPVPVPVATPVPAPVATPVPAPVAAPAPAPAVRTFYGRGGISK